MQVFELEPYFGTADVGQRTGMNERRTFDAVRDRTGRCTDIRCGDRHLAGAVLAMVIDPFIPSATDWGSFM